ncbi:Glucose/Sorbosone dehydrogenase [Gracilaria domingensis]|nr:Glucose/Sorbosone dehydrogenase [Gracilaria domingensis]
MYRTATSVALIALVLSAALAANPVSIPIIHGQFSVQTRKFAKLPDFNGESAKIVCIVPHGNDLYVCTLHAVYRINPQGVVSLYLNVEYAISASTNRMLDFSNKMHGGVRSIAFHPNFAQNGRVYIAAMESRPTNPRDFYYLSDAQKPIKADSVLLEFIHDFQTGVPNVFTYRNVFRVGMPVFDHPIKQIAFFGNYLYIAHGDGSIQSATAGGGQKKDALGKILRVNPLRQGSLPFTVPPGNPFVNKPFMLNEVYAMGFRNPHTISFGKDGTLYVADAGRDNIEEINLVVKGGNYGWSTREGTFVHESGGGLVTGVSPLPANDAAYGYIYPAAQVGHEGKEGAGFVGQAVAGGCPVENGSPMGGKYYYADFPKSGKLFYSTIYELKHARTTGPPWQLSQARTRQAIIYYEHDGFPGTPPLRFNTLGDVVKHDGEQVKGRVDVRMGRGPRGELYWSSKSSGRVYLFTSSLPGGP